MLFKKEILKAKKRAGWKAEVILTGVTVREPYTAAMVESDGIKGVGFSKCNPTSDSYNAVTGIYIALSRAVRDLKRQADGIAQS